MKIIHKRRLYFFYIIFFLLLVGPNIKILNVEIQFWLFFFFFIHIFFAKSSQNENLKVPIIFALPTILVSGSFILKSLVFSDYSDLLQCLKYAMLYCYSYTIIKITQDYPISLIEKIAENILKILSISVIYVSIIGILQYYNPSFLKTFFSIFYDKGYSYSSDLTSFMQAVETNRISSIYENAMVFGGAMSLFVLSIVVFKKKKYSLFDKTAIVLGCITIFLANTRSPMIGLLLGLSIWMIIYNRSKILIYVALIPIVLILQREITANNQKFKELNSNRITEITDYIASGFDSRFIPGSMLSRLENIGYSIDLFSNSKYIFTGITKNYYISVLAGRRVSFHNQFVSWIIMFGFMGFIFSLYFILLIYFLHKKIHIVKDDGLKYLLTSSLIILITAFIICLSQPALLSLRWREFMYFYFTLIYIMYKKKIMENDKNNLIQSQ